MHAILRRFIDETTSCTISDEEFLYIEKGFTEKSIKKKQFLLHEGTVCKYMAFIVKGAMRQYSIDGNGNEHIVRFGMEGWWMSDRESFLMLTPSKYNIEALEDCDLLVATNEQLAMVKEQSLLFLKMSHILDARHSIASQNRIQASISYTAEQKVLELMKVYPLFLKRFSQAMLASYLGLSPETFSRIRKQIAANNTNRQV
ncbi:Crp/Fnr family transcriptional regulator [Parachryseolinea silvisoli]|jgi:CRP-like cAMP-binding protein|uniref:Crp/Fnr family transcriptional regulator n=1 Tax=Parachryseolinea silvisoli TaxID=2873601 RepID=UPI0022659858|nr:Crp/Fnr family transcriptional regulator [Parachryseolinea silvisoli]MCD9014856.1 Crp/Fnr family transcriptional regulator [Parachryseolinea silvisoli]